MLADLGLQVPDAMLQGDDRRPLDAHDRFQLLDPVVSPIAHHDRRTVGAAASDASKLAAPARGDRYPGRERLPWINKGSMWDHC